VTDMLWITDLSEIRLGEYCVTRALVFADAQLVIKVVFYHIW